MKKKVKVTFSTTFYHSKETIQESCGINEIVLYNFLSEKLKSYVYGEGKEGTLSELIEWTIKNMPSDYFIYVVSKDLDEKLKRLAKKNKK